MKKEPNKKTIYWIRHGEAESNISDLNSGIIDPNLTTKGFAQCAELKLKINLLNIIPEIQLYLVSPLERTFNTFISVFDNNLKKKNISLEEIREQIDKPCHKRNSIDSKINRYKTICFDNIKTNSDQLYINVKGTETNEQLCKRIEKFLIWLSERDESNIVVVTHGSFLFALFNQVLPNNPINSINSINSTNSINLNKPKYYTKMDINKKKYINTFFNNCEMKITEIYFN